MFLEPASLSIVTFLDQVGEIFTRVEILEAPAEVLLWACTVPAIGIVVWHGAVRGRHFGHVLEAGARRGARDAVRTRARTTEATVSVRNFG